MDCPQVKVGDILHIKNYGPTYRLTADNKSTWTDKVSKVSPKGLAITSMGGWPFRWGEFWGYSNQSDGLTQVVMKITEGDKVKYERKR